MDMKLSDIPDMNSAKFTFENSGKRANEACVYQMSRYGEPILSTYAAIYRPIGKTFNPPFLAAWQDDENGVAIMYETPDGERMWWHHMMPDDEANASTD